MNEVKIGLLVNLLTLDKALKNLNIEGRRWWLVSDPKDTIERQYISIGYGQPSDIITPSIYNAK